MKTTLSPNSPRMIKAPMIRNLIPTADIQTGEGPLRAIQVPTEPRTSKVTMAATESAVDADAIFSQLLGKDASQRYNMIMDEAGEVDDIDL